jgi:hypothetical protein
MLGCCALRRFRPSLLSLALVIGTLCFLATPAGAELDEGPAQLAAGSDPVGTEVPALRSEYASVFRASDGTLTARISTRPVNYERPDGSWAHVDPTLVSTNADGYAWRNAGGPLELKFAQFATAQKIAAVELDGRSIGFALEGMTSASLGTVEGDRISYLDALPGVDLVYESKANGLKELLILDAAPARPLSFRFPLALQGLTPRSEADGAISLLGIDGKVEFFIPAGSMSDSARDPESGEAAFSEAVEYELERNGADYVLEVTPDLAWLQDPRRVYPVEIDPSVTKYPTLDTFVQTGVTSGQSGSDELKAGTFDSGSTKARSLLKFDLSSLSGKEILNATLSLHEFHSWSCTASEVQARRVLDSWGSGVVWSNRPTTTGARSTR